MQEGFDRSLFYPNFGFGALVPKRQTHATLASAPTGTASRRFTAR
jgi:hypothetical protein